MNGRFSPIAFMAISLSVALLGLLVAVRFNFDLFTPAIDDPIKAKFQLWLFWIVVQAIAWVVSATYLHVTFVRFSQSFKKHAFETALVLLLPLMYLAISLMRPHGTPIPPDHIRSYDISHLRYFGMWGVVLAFLGVWEMYLVRAVLIEESQLVDLFNVQRFLELREEVSRLLFVSVGILVLGTLSSAGLRTAANAWKGDLFFQEEYVVLYGALNSLFLVVVYVPVQTSFFFVGRRLREQMLNKPEASVDGIKTWYENRKKLGEILGLNFSQLSALGAPLSTLLPFLSGWISHLLGAK